MSERERERRENRELNMSLFHFIDIWITACWTLSRYNSSNVEHHLQIKHSLCVSKFIYHVQIMKIMGHTNHRPIVLHTFFLFTLKSICVLVLGLRFAITFTIYKKKKNNNTKKKKKYHSGKKRTFPQIIWTRMKKKKWNIFSILLYILQSDQHLKRKPVAPTLS